jgi:hypothetical protein
MSPSSLQFSSSIVLEGDIAMAEQYRTVTYECDVCIRCGRLGEKRV